MHATDMLESQCPHYGWLELTAPTLTIHCNNTKGHLTSYVSANALLLGPYCSCLAALVLPWYCYCPSAVTFLGLP